LPFLADIYLHSYKNLFSGPERQPNKTFFGSSFLETRRSSSL